jgi:S1-C subfamily serine protease
LDPIVQNSVKLVDPKSPAAAAGIRTGDSIRTVAKQRILTLADFSRVLELTPESGTLAITVERPGGTVATQVRLPAGWRKSDDPSWRSSTGMVGPASGFWGKKASNKEKVQMGLGQDDLALKINFIWGQWTKDAGIRHGDIVTAIDGQKADMTIRQLQAYLHLNRNWGDKIELEVWRGGKARKISMQLPKERPNG